MLVCEEVQCRTSERVSPPDKIQSITVAYCLFGHCTEASKEVGVLKHRIGNKQKGPLESEFFSLCPHAHVALRIFAFSGNMQKP